MKVRIPAIRARRFARAALPIAPILWLGAGVPAALMRRSYGNARALRFAATIAAAFLLQQTLVQTLVRGTTRQAVRRLDLVDLLTLSRGLAAAMVLGVAGSGVHDRRGTASWIAWTPIVPSATLSDWIDGPLARRRGVSPFGAVLDLELDSWLTLSCAVGAVALTGLPRLALLPPLARYALVIRAVSRGQYEEFARAGSAWWSRTTGTAQMAIFIVALAPFSGTLSSRLARWATLVVAPLQTISMIGVLMAGERSRASGPPD